MGIGAIRAAARAALVTGTGLGEVLARPPDNVGALPSAWFGDATATVQMGSLEVWTWRLPLTVAVARKGVYAMESEAVEALLDGIMAKVRSNFTLGGTTFGWNIVEFREGVVQVGGVDLVGFTLTATVKEKTPRSYTG